MPLPAPIFSYLCLYPVFIFFLISPRGPLGVLKPFGAPWGPRGALEALRALGPWGALGGHGGAGGPWGRLGAPVPLGGPWRPWEPLGAPWGYQGPGDCLRWGGPRGPQGLK